jgi:hypothetical protein
LVWGPASLCRQLNQLWPPDLKTLFFTLKRTFMRNIKTRSLLFMCLFLLGIWQACIVDRLPCNALVQDAEFGFKIYSKNGVNQIAKWGARYLSDSTYFTKMDGTLPKQFRILGDGSISFYFPSSQKEAIDTPATHTFLLHLPDYDGIPYKDTDTIAFTYKASRIKEYICCEWLRIHYNGKQFYEGPFEGFMVFEKN